MRVALPPLQIVLLPLRLKAAGDTVLMATVLGALVPQPLVVDTVMLPVELDVTTAIVLVDELPDQPEGSDQL